MKKNKNSIKSYTNIIRGQRKDWGAVNPVTKVIPDKRRKPPKHKGRESADE